MKIEYPLASLDELELHNVQADLVNYQGRQAMRLDENYQEGTDEEAIAIISASNFKEGVIETEIVGTVRPDAPADVRGFVGIAFRVQSQGKQFECFYIRPTNGRAEVQIRRNHATQYVSHPDYPWYRLREENPGVYESYTDLVPGEWTPIKIVVAGEKAQLYVNNAEQPCLIVNDLKLGADGQGQIALWVGGGTVAYFSAIRVSG